jgi:PmbA protein
MTPLERAQTILAQAGTPGVQAEVFLSESESRLSEWSEGQPENTSFTQTQGFGLRLIEQGKLGFASANVTAAEGVAHAIAQARAAKTFVSPDDHLTIPTLSAGVPRDSADLELVDAALTSAGFDERSAFLAGLEADVRRRDPRLTKVLRASYREGRSVDAAWPAWRCRARKRKWGTAFMPRAMRGI